MLYLLTTRKAHLQNLRQLNVRLINASEDTDVLQFANSFSLVLEALDEYSTKADLEQVWENQIAPYQQELREARGQAPRGKRVPSLKRLRAGLPLYQVWFKLQSIAAVLDHLEEIDPSWGKMEPERARRVILELRNLLEPHEEEAQD